MYHIDEDEKTGQSAWFATNDIAARAEAAYKRHTVFFDSVRHCNRVALAVQLAKGAAQLYKAVYETARDSRNGPYTEVKLDRVEFALGARDRLEATLTNLGFEFKYMPKTQSFRIFAK